jgi:hypothetical protein
MTLTPRHDIRVLRPPTLPRGKRFETEADAEEYRDAAISKLNTVAWSRSRDSQFDLIWRDK